MKYRERSWRGDVGGPSLCKFNEIIGRNYIQIGQYSAKKRLLNRRKL